MNNVGLTTNPILLKDTCHLMHPLLLEQRTYTPISVENSFDTWLLLSRDIVALANCRFQGLNITPSIEILFRGEH